MGIKIAWFLDLNVPFFVPVWSLRLGLSLALNRSSPKFHHSQPSVTNVKIDPHMNMLKKKTVSSRTCINSNNYPPSPGSWAPGQSCRPLTRRSTSLAASVNKVKVGQIFWLVDQTWYAVSDWILDSRRRLASAWWKIIWRKIISGDKFPTQVNTGSANVSSKMFEMRCGGFVFSYRLTSSPPTIIKK